MTPIPLRGEGTQTPVDDNEIDDQMVLPSTLEKDMAAPQSLIEHFAKLEDPRVDRNKKHELIDVIVLCVCAVVSGANGWSDIEEFGRAKLEWLRRYVPLANGVPVDDTIARIVSALSVSGFQECFRSWMEDVVTLGGGEIVAVDGCCFPLYLVRAPHELTGLFRRRISWDDGAIRDTSDRGEAAFLMTDGCRSDADAVARAALGPRSQAPA